MSSTEAQLCSPHAEIAVEVCEEAVETIALPGLIGRGDKHAPFRQAIENVDWNVAGDGSVPAHRKWKGRTGRYLRRPPRSQGRKKSRMLVLHAVWSGNPLPTIFSARATGMKHQLGQLPSSLRCARKASTCFQTPGKLRLTQSKFCRGRS